MYSEWTIFVCKQFPEFAATVAEPSKDSGVHFGAKLLSNLHRLLKVIFRVYAGMKVYVSGN